MSSPCTRWCFTLNNWTNDEQQQLRDGFPDTFAYLVFGREVGESGTAHLQGFFCLHSRSSLRQVRRIPGLARSHLERTRGKSHQAAAYCKKDDDFDEFGQIPPEQGQRVDFEEFIEWVKNQDPAPTMQDVGQNFPSIYMRYAGAAERAIRDFGQRPKLVVGELRPWQQRLVNLLESPADDRKVIFVVDENGNSGKSWLTRYLITEREDVQIFGVGKRDDLAYAIDETKRIFMFDVTRGGMEFIQYGVLEMIKNRIVFSPKYMSKSKYIRSNAHVVVFCNEQPDRNAMTQDRYKIINIRH